MLIGDNSTLIPARFRSSATHFRYPGPRRRTQLLYTFVSKYAVITISAFAFARPANGCASPAAALRQRQRPLGACAG